MSFSYIQYKLLEKMVVREEMISASLPIIHCKSFIFIYIYIYVHLYVHISCSCKYQIFILTFRHRGKTLFIQLPYTGIIYIQITWWLFSTHSRLFFSPRIFTLIINRRKMSCVLNQI